MSKKWYQCGDCGKNLATYHSLWRHKKSCKSIPTSLSISEYGNDKREQVDDGILNSINPHHRNRIPVVSEQNGRFVVEKDGSISDIKILKGVDQYIDQESIKVIKAMPKWKPGKQMGKKVRVRQILPLKFTLMY